MGDFLKEFKRTKDGLPPDLVEHLQSYVEYRGLLYSRLLEVHNCRVEKAAKAIENSRSAPPCPNVFYVFLLVVTSALSTSPCNRYELTVRVISTCVLCCRTYAPCLDYSVFPASTGFVCYQVQPPWRKMLSSPEALHCRFTIQRSSSSCA